MNQVNIRRLGWAGAEIEYNGETLLIDYILDTSPLPMQDPSERFPVASYPGQASVALLTHLHADHADAEALQNALQKRAPVFRPEKATGGEADLTLTEYAENKLTNHPLSAEILDVWAERRVSSFTIYSAPSVDGFGDVQLSWMIECGGKRIFHAGDTIFHSYWWRIKNRFGSPDVAFLPINAAIVEFPFLQPASPLAAVLSPEGAAVAAHILGAKCVVPIHYHSLHKPPQYIETPHATERLEANLKPYHIDARISKPGEWFTIE